MEGFADKRVDNHLIPKSFPQQFCLLGGAAQIFTYGYDFGDLETVMVEVRHLGELQHVAEVVLSVLGPTDGVVVVIHSQVLEEVAQGLGGTLDVPVGEDELVVLLHLGMSIKRIIKWRWLYV